MLVFFFATVWLCLLTGWIVVTVCQTQRKVLTKLACKSYQVSFGNQHGFVIDNVARIAFPARASRRPNKWLSDADKGPMMTVAYSFFLGTYRVATAQYGRDLTLFKDNWMVYYEEAQYPSTVSIDDVEAVDQYNDTTRDRFRFCNDGTSDMQVIGSSPY